MHAGVFPACCGDNVIVIVGAARVRGYRPYVRIPSAAERTFILAMMFAHCRSVVTSVRALGRSSVGGSISSVSARSRRTPRARTSIAAGVGAILMGAFFSLKLRSTQHDGCDEKQKQAVGFWLNFVSQNIVPSKQQAIHN